MDVARAQRQAALEEKKKRLEELKLRRQQRATTNVTPQDQAQARIGASAMLDDYIDGLLQVPAGSAAVGDPENQDASASASTASSAVPLENGSSAAAVVLDEANETTSSSSAQPASSASTAATAATPVSKTETFEMATQTADDEFPATAGDRDNDEDASRQKQTAEAEARELELAEATNRLALAERERLREAKVLTAEEVEKELLSEAFSSFLNATSKKVERVLGSDLLADLLIDYDEDANGSKRALTKASDGSKFISSRQIYRCPKWTATRDVTDMDWSPLHRELMLCGYHMPSSGSSLGQSVGSSAVKVVSPDDTPSDSLAPRMEELLSDGLALVWNLAMPSRPEHIFTCGSPVTTNRFHPSESPLILGGCQSGQVVVWDIRAGRMPVQKSSLTTTSSGNSKGHTRPIVSMEVIEGGVSSLCFLLRLARACRFVCC